jgi:hypothetical protein
MRTPQSSREPETEIRNPKLETNPKSEIPMTETIDSRRFFSFPSSAWERTSAKLRFA